MKQFYKSLFLLTQIFQKLLEQLQVQQMHQEGEFRRGPPPVLAREAVERELLDASLDAVLRDTPHAGHAPAMPLDPRQAALLRPATVAIHNDGDMPRFARF